MSTSSSHIRACGNALCYATILFPAVSYALPSNYGNPVHPNKCTEENTFVHKEWSALSPAERNDYTSSVKCLMELPPQTPKELAPGVQNRYDDFTAVHINNTLLIHANGVFLGWHRHFLHLFQRALTEECGYKGAIPYWNWPWWADDLAASPLFDGSETSLGGDGYWNASTPAVTNGNYSFPRGNGGGCIEKGALANITTGFRMFHNEEILKTELPEDALFSAPRCVTRDLNNVITGPNHKLEVVKKLLVAPTVGAFQAILDGSVRNTSQLGPHSAGHWGLGLGMQDQFASPSDPAFYLHHSMIDNLWAQWQMQDPESRTFALNGTVTTLNNPPSQQVTLDFYAKFGYLDSPRKMGEIMTEQDGSFCHRYEYDVDAPKPCEE